MKLLPLIALTLALCGASVTCRADKFDEYLAIAEEQRTNNPQLVKEILSDLDGNIYQVDDSKKLRYYQIKAHNLAIHGDFDAALEIIGQLEKSSLEHQTKAMLLLAQIEKIRGNYEESLKSIQKAIAHLEDTKDQQLRFSILDVAATILGSAQSYEKAIEYGSRALELAKESNNLKDICHATNTLAEIHERSNYAAAADELYQAQELACKDVDLVLYSSALVGRGWVAYQQGRCIDALPMLKQAADGYARAGYISGLAYVQLITAACQLETGLLDDAYNNVQKTLPKLEEQGALDILQTGYEVAAALEERKNNLAGALMYERKLRQTEKVILGTERNQRIALIQVQMDMNQKNNDLARLRQENTILELRSQSQSEKRRLLQFGVGAVSIICILLMLALHRLRNQSLQLRKLAQIDGLTGLHNRRHALMLAEQLYASCLRRNSPLAVVMVDLDLFKEINDRFGHAAGDEVLRSAARHFASCLRKQDVIGRTGGEEFAIFLPDTDLNAAITVVERCRSGVGEVQEGEQRRSVTASFGIAVASNDRFTLDELLQQADKALYSAKANGRNQVAIARDLAFAASAYDEPASLI